MVLSFQCLKNNGPYLNRVCKDSNWEYQYTRLFHICPSGHWRETLRLNVAGGNVSAQVCFNTTSVRDI